MDSIRSFKTIAKQRHRAQRVDGPETRTLQQVLTSDGYRTCSVCGGDCEPDVSFGSDEHGVRIEFVCSEHGVQSLVDPFEHLR